MCAGAHIEFAGLPFDDLVEACAWRNFPVLQSVRLEIPTIQSPESNSVDIAAVGHSAVQYPDVFGDFGQWSSRTANLSRLIDFDVAWIELDEHLIVGRCIDVLVNCVIANGNDCPGVFHNGIFEDSFSSAWSEHEQSRLEGMHAGTATAVNAAFRSR